MSYRENDFCGDSRTAALLLADGVETVECPFQFVFSVLRGFIMMVRLQDVVVQVQLRFLFTSRTTFILFCLLTVEFRFDFL